MLQVLLWQEPPHRIGMARYARAAGWTLTRVDTDRIGKHTRLQDADGIICQLRRRYTDLLAAVRRAGVPVVQLNSYVPEISPAIVEPDYIAAGRMTARHLLERSFRHFAYLGNQSVATAANSLLSGYTEELASGGFSARPILIDAVPAPPPTEVWPRPLQDETAATHQAYLAHELRTAPQPLGLLCETFELAVEAIDACAADRLAVPEQVAIVTIVDFAFEAELTDPPLSAIEMDYEQQGYVAAQWLDRIMGGAPPPPRPVLIPPKTFVVRASSDTYAIDHAGTARALRFIMQNLHRHDLSMAMIVRAASMSRRNLYYSFRKNMGAPVAAVISRLRLEKAQRLLRESELPVDDVARQCGFAGSQHLRRTLRRAAGVAPRQYRHAAEAPAGR